MPDKETMGDVQAALHNAEAAIPPFEVDTDKFYSVVTPEGCERDVIDFEPMHPRPRRAKGTVVVATVDSFCNLVASLSGGFAGTAGADNVTRVYADEAGVIAVLNDNDAGRPGWCDHRVYLPFTADNRYGAWVQASGRMMEQVAFAEFIEDNVEAVNQPTGADMLELAQSFRASRNATFSSDKRLKSGQTQVTYQEVLEASAGKAGNIEIPDELLLVVPILKRGPAQQVRVKFRYRLHDGQLTLGVRIVSRDDVWQQAVDDAVEAIQKKLAITVVYGHPPTERA